MTTCPNCNYELVLLSSRHKYKCALCSKLYSKKEIENKEFREWNKRQRQLDLENLKLKKRGKLTEKEKLQKRKLYYENNKERLKELQRKWRDKNREIYNKTKRDYWNKKSKQLNSKRRERYNLRKEQVLSYQKQWEQDNPHDYRINKRLKELREQQKALALQLCKNKEYKLYTPKFQDFLPTFVLSDLLQK